MQVDNTAFLLEKLASDCSPLQYIRELTKNAMETIQARMDTGWAGPGEILWDADWALVESGGLYKLQISDNGTGMTGAEMELLINALSSSGRVQSLTKNFGVGAKITAGVENPVGLVYKSWVDGHGEMVHLWKDPDQQVYGLKQFELPNGDFAHHASIKAELKAQNIETSGTAVVLLGKHDDEHTMKPDGLPLKWLIKYLNTRFFRIPDNITIKVRDFSRSDPENWPSSPTVSMGDGGSQLRTIKGMHDHLTNKAVSHGVKHLSDASVYWYVLPAERIEQSDIWESSAHIAALFQDELYEMRTGRSALARLREFGMVFGADRVVIYVEPDTTKLDVVSNIARSGLLIQGEELPWSRWASEFRADMPQDLRNLMDEITSAAEGRDHRDAIKRRLREIRGLFRVSRYKRSANGPVRIGGRLPGGGDPHPTGPNEGRRGSTSGGRGGASSSDIYGAFITADGEPGVAVAGRQSEPAVHWVSIADGTRSENDEMEDRAALYVSESNLIQANRDFRVFQDMIREVSNRYSQTPEVLGQVKDSVEEWFEQQLIEAVMGLLALQGSPQWDTATLQKAYSPEGLTAAVMPRYNTFRMITRSLGARLGAAASIVEADAVEAAPTP
jgi:hypothetical protein